MMKLLLLAQAKEWFRLNHINKPFWKSKSSKYYGILSKIYQQAVTNCPKI